MRATVWYFSQLNPLVSGADRISYALMLNAPKVRINLALSKLALFGKTTPPPLLFSTVVRWYVACSSQIRPTIPLIFVGHLSKRLSENTDCFARDNSSLRPDHCPLDHRMYSPLLPVIWYDPDLSNMFPPRPALVNI